MILAVRDRKELESSVRSVIREIKIWTDLARSVIPSQGDVEEFAYGFICGMVIGAFTERFVVKNGRQPDRDEMADLFLIIRNQMPAVRRAVLNEFESGQ